MRKKAQGLPLNTIVIAVIALIVLIVLVLIFRGQIGVFNKGTSCDARGGKCMNSESGEVCPSERPIKIYTQECPVVGDGKGAGQCCIPLGQ
jgi:hypothetical protein